jgi:hypothetical protein
MRLQPIERFEVQDEYEILASYEVIREVVNGITLDSTKVRANSDGKNVILKGHPVGKITASGKYGPYTHTTLSAAAASTDTTITVSDASLLVAGDDIDVNGTAATISSINYDTNVITLTAAVGVAKASGDSVDLNDGRENPTVVLKHSYDVTLGDHVATGYEVAKVISERIPFTVDQKLKDKMRNIIFA